MPRQLDAAELATAGITELRRQLLARMPAGITARDIASFFTRQEASLRETLAALIESQMAEPLPPSPALSIDPIPPYILAGMASRDRVLVTQIQGLATRLAGTPVGRAATLVVRLMIGEGFLPWRQAAADALRTWRENAAGWGHLRVIEGMVPGSLLAALRMFDDWELGGGAPEEVRRLVAEISGGPPPSTPPTSQPTDDDLSEQRMAELQATAGSRLTSSAVVPYEVMGKLVLREVGSPFKQGLLAPTQKGFARFADLAYSNVTYSDWTLSAVAREWFRRQLPTENPKIDDDDWDEVLQDATVRYLLKSKRPQDREKFRELALEMGVAADQKAPRSAGKRGACGGGAGARFWRKGRMRSAEFKAAAA